MQFTSKIEIVMFIVVGFDEIHAFVLEIIHRDAKESNAKFLLLYKIYIHDMILVQLLNIFQYRLIFKFVKAQPINKIEFAWFELYCFFFAAAYRPDWPLRPNAFKAFSAAAATPVVASASLPI